MAMENNILEIKTVFISLNVLLLKMLILILNALPEMSL